MDLPVDPGPDYSLFDFDPTKDAPKLEAMANVYNADNPDLKPFDRSGGKLIIYHGWADPLITPGGTVNYVRDAMSRSGGREVTEDFMRLFLLPGVYHCSGGPGEDTVDWLTQIQKWVEDQKSAYDGKINYAAGYEPPAVPDAPTDTTQ